MSYVDKFKSNVNKLLAEREAFDKVQEAKAKEEKAAKAAAKKAKA